MGMDWNLVTVRRSDRKTISLTVTRDGKIQVSAPLRLPDAQIRAFVESKSAWIEKHLARTEKPVTPLSVAERKRLSDYAKQILPARVAYYAARVGVTYGRISVRFQQSRWGSCSSAGNLNFNALLMLTPQNIVDYVIVHELCHRREMNHSPRFWAEVARVFPGYRESRRWLRENGNTLMRRIADTGTDTKGEEV